MTIKIIISGAGLSGLALAAASRQQDPSIMIDIYERDGDFGERAQGYSIGLKGDAGLRVVRELGAWESLAEDSVPITNFVFTDQLGRRLLELPNDGRETKNATVRVRRTALRDALRAAAPDVPIHFGTAITGFRLDHDHASAQLDDAREVSADWIVAADGVSSPLRRQLIGDRPQGLGLQALVGDSASTVEHRLLSGGYFMSLGDRGDSVFCYREQGGVHISYTRHSDAATEEELDPETILALLVEGTWRWHSPVPEVVAALDRESLVARHYYDKEPLTRVRDGRLWLIGDAAHPMVPFQGQGANLGLLDALQLGRWLAAGAAEPAGGTLEKELVERGRKAVLESRRAAEQFHLTSRPRQLMRDLGFRMANTFIALGPRISRRRS